jgi:hypothetical protein
MVYTGASVFHHYMIPFKEEIQPVRFHSLVELNLPSLFVICHMTNLISVPFFITSFNSTSYFYFNTIEMKGNEKLLSNTYIRENISI